MNEKILKRKGLVRGPECPECGSMFTPVYNTGHDENGLVIRLRVCRQCDHSFGTVELSLPDNFVFSRTDTFRRSRSKRVAFYSSDLIVVPKQPYIRKGEKSDYCAKGLHELLGDNVYISPSGERRCRGCRAVTTRKYQHEHRDERNRKAREYYRSKQSRKVAA